MSAINHVSMLHYIETERFIENFEQKSRRLVRQLRLYPYEIETNCHRFQLDHIFDISFKDTSGDFGFLYLHTNQGVFMFLVEDDPKEFIYAYKNLRS